MILEAPVKRQILPARFPFRKGACGPVTAEHIKRFLVIYGVVVAAGFGICMAVENIPMQIFGLGVMLPGGGFIAHAGLSDAPGLIHTALAFFGVISFVIAVILWFATGNVLAPLAVWAMLAMAASCMNHGHPHPGAAVRVLSMICGFVALAMIVAGYRQWHGAVTRGRANAWLDSASAPVIERFRGVEYPAQLVFTPDDLKRMRFLLDRALQPVTEFNGFEWCDQFQTAAIRYQLNFAGYALSMAQATHLPAFGGYLQEAQRNLIAKQTDHRVWGYWALENLWGNLRRDADPAARENIMFTGFCAMQMAMYHAASGRQDFNVPGSFALHHPSGRTYAYDLPALVGGMESEMKRSPFHLIACEPNWIYPLCNTIGGAAMRACEPAQWAEHESSFRRNLEHEFVDPEGRFIPARSRYTGFALPAIGGAMPQALPCFFLNATMPDIALRQWLLLRSRILDGRHLRRTAFWRIDTGNYGFSRASAYAATALAAAELGDEEVRRLCLEALEEECPVRTDDGHYYRPRASVWAHAVEFMARSTVRNGFCDLIHTPAQAPMNPRIEKAVYPDVLVAGAVSRQGMLNAILYPGGCLGRQEIEISGLQRGANYVCHGTDEERLIADAEGKAIVHVMLDGRREIQLTRQI